MKPAIACLLCAVLAAAPAHATIYKCLLDDGRVFYQDAPCAPGRQLRDFDKDPANVSVLPFTQPAPAAKSRSGSGKEKAARPAAAPRSEAKAKKSEAVGDAKQRKFLRPGMSEGEVVARVGPPDMTSSRNRKGHRWTYMPVPDDRNTITNLTFDNGRLIEIERKVIR
jgi:hypothetical protein